ncbi:LacI family DNA-binding transcriptional regulator [Lacticaseibacillus rhamnosus]|uniref:LacI family DNA-binding transcriptional regulator n=1 Tax=Lacticaseibacillus rhamnosus TaxID=47715 RepID=UPI00065AD4B0|nr:LacI family DNA-binding transcriptional regulator [Lacticaseibacillus rhamnosus]KMO48193.1 LacI family transcriptional regulator [Lacticaseibacillus rhamnosus]OAU05716.1 LacI family transcriptional regulator [Lacticaseibacillus rhamnosus]
MATISEIAAAAGVGVTTVSRYLNHHPYISADKKARIEAAIKTLGYTPSAAATSLRAQATGNIGVLVSRVTNPFFAGLFDAIERTLHAHGYQVMISQTYDDPDAEERFLNQLKSRELDGVILASVEAPARVATVAKAFPGRVVVVNADVQIPNAKSLVLPHYQATRDALDYLFAQGHRRFAYMTGGAIKSARHGQSRTQAFFDFMQARGLPVEPAWLFEQVHTATEGQTLGRQIAALAPAKRPDAIFTNSDEVAVGVVDSLVAANIAVPDDIAVMGYDDQPFAPFARVPLTTVHQPVAEMAQVATDLLLSGLGRGEPAATLEPLTLTLKIRQSA